MVGDGRIRSAWNHLLITKVISVAYAHLLQSLASRENLTIEEYYELWPVEGSSAPWRLLTDTVLQSLAKEPLVQTVSNGTKAWRPLTETVTVDPQHWNNKDKLEPLLSAMDVPLASLPKNLLQALIRVGVEPRFCNPRFFREWLSDPSTHTQKDSLNRDQKLFLLEFILSDLSGDEYKQLSGVPLLPLADGSFATFLAPRSKGDEDEEEEMKGRNSDDTLKCVYISTKHEIDLLPSSHSRLVHIESLPDTVASHFKHESFLRHTQLTRINPSSFASLLYASLPQEWKGVNRLELTKAAESAPFSFSVEYLVKLWTYISQCPDLSLFSEFPLLLCRGDTLCCLSSDSHLLSPWTSTAIIDASETFECLGLNFVDEKMAWSHPRKNELILNSENPVEVLLTVHRILEADDSVLSSFRSRATGAALSNQCNAFRSYVATQLSRLSSMKVPEEVLMVLRTLPVFECYPKRRWKQINGDDHKPDIDTIEASETSFPFVSLSERKLYVAPADLDHRLLGSSFIRAGSPGERDLLRFAGVEERSGASIYLEDVFPYLSHMDDELRDSTMLTVLQQLPHLYREDPSISSTLRTLRFIPSPPSSSPSPSSSSSSSSTTTTTSSSKSGSIRLRRARDLYDPRVEDVVDLIGKDSPLFPCQNFCSDSTLVTLVGLGLRLELDLRGAATAVQRIESISQSVETEKKQQARRLAEKLLQYLNQHLPTTGDGGALSEVEEEEESDEEEKRKEEGGGETESEMGIKESRRILRETKWLPILRESPLRYHPWRRAGEEEWLCSAAESRKKEELQLCSASKFLPSVDVYNQSLLHLFGWDSPVSTTDVIQQLLAFVNMFHASTDKTASSSSSPSPSPSADSNPSHNDEECRNRVIMCVPLLYKALSDRLDTDEDEMVAALRGVDWVWMGDGFSQCSYAAFSSVLELRPYIAVVPPDMQPYHALLRRLGVRQEFSGVDYAFALERMATEAKEREMGTESGGNTDPEEKGTDENDQIDRGAVVTPLDPLVLDKAIVLVQYLSDHMNEVSSLLYIPNQHGCLQLARSLVYDDASWLTSQGGAAYEEHTFVHPKLSNKVSEAVGAQSLRRKLVNTTSESISMNIQTAEAFGQSEDLTRRLQNIIALYPDGPGILYEMIQNSDDAGASEVEFFLDMRTHGTSSLLGPSMAEWQGPALYVYNNARFTEQDFYNLSKIGQGSKLDNINATGKFGLGFNSVYHFTGVPSIVSGPYLVVFDPHAKYLPGASSQQPGLKFHFTKAKPALVDQFPDQFSPYLLFGCDMKHEFDGTMFRLPLRNSKTASESGIKREPCSIQDVNDLLESFKTFSAQSLLFLRNVDKIKVTVRDDDKAHTLFDVSLSDHRKNLPTAWNQLPSFLGGASNLQAKSVFYDRLVHAKPDTLPQSMYHLDVTCYESAHLQVEKGSTANGGCGAARVVHAPSASVRDEYIVFEKIGGKNASAMAADASKKHLKLLPFGGIAAHMKRNGKALESVDLGGRAFCSLPLPVPTGLPAHVNAYFELSANRRGM